MNEQLRATCRRVGRVVGAFLVVCLVVGAVGYALGPDPGVRSAPAVDADERPSQVVADAAAQLWVRDHTWELWVEERNRTTGRVSGGIRWRMRVQHSRDRVRIVVWDVPAQANETVGPADPPERRGFATRYQGWVTSPDADGWRRHDAAYGPTASAPVRSVAGLRNASMTVVSENETALVVRTSDERAMGALQMGGRGNVTATFVVAKTADPYLSRVTVRQEADGTVEVTVVDVSDVGTTTAPRPDSIPQVTLTEVAQRTLLGLKSLV